MDEARLGERSRRVPAPLSPPSAAARVNERAASLGHLVPPPAREHRRRTDRDACESTSATHLVKDAHPRPACARRRVDLSVDGDRGARTFHASEPVSAGRIGRAREALSSSGIPHDGADGVPSSIRRPARVFRRARTTVPTEAASIDASVKTSRAPRPRTPSADEGPPRAFTVSRLRHRDPTLDVFARPTTELDLRPRGGPIIRRASRDRVAPRRLPHYRDPRAQPATPSIPPARGG